MTQRSGATTTRRDVAIGVDDGRVAAYRSAAPGRRVAALRAGAGAVACRDVAIRPTDRSLIATSRHAIAPTSTSRPAIAPPPTSRHRRDACPYASAQRGDAPSRRATSRDVAIWRDDDLTRRRDRHRRWPCRSVSISRAWTARRRTACWRWDGGLSRRRDQADRPIADRATRRPRLHEDRPDLLLDGPGFLLECDRELLDQE